MDDRRKDERRKLFGQRFLAMLIGVLPEDRRKAERRRAAAEPPGASQRDSGANTAPAEDADR
ncbi:MAG TPA: hypothetical protein VGD01_08335 [Candidatus Elarobacter sp.]|jgi:hypothetical protein